MLYEIISVIDEVDVSSLYEIIEWERALEEARRAQWLKTEKEEYADHVAKIHEHA